MEYVQFMGPVLSVTIGPTAFSHKILSERSQWEAGHVRRIRPWEIYMDYKNRPKKTEQHKEHTTHRKTLRLYSKKSLIVWRE